MKYYLVKFNGEKLVDYQCFDGTLPLERFFVLEYLKHGYMMVKSKQYAEMTGDPEKVWGEDFFKLSWREQNLRMMKAQEGCDCLRFRHRELCEEYWMTKRKEKEMEEGTLEG